MKANRLVLVALMLVSCGARADAIVDWNRHASAAMAAAGPAIAGNPIAMARILAMTHTAMSDAINACEPSFKPYLAGLPGHAGCAPLAAAHAAAHTVLVAMLAAQAQTFDETYARALAAVPDDARKAAGIAVGEQAARLLLAQRENDGASDTTDTYRPLTTPGSYVGTGLPVVSNVALRKPFVIGQLARFRPGPPPALDSREWARDYNETKAWGAFRSARRTPWQTETAQFWQQLGTPAWNQAARSLSDQRTLALAENARMFALLNIAMFDAYLAVFDAKYHYQFWRPITAIRNGDRDGNDATERDPAWKPLIDTPPHPEYPCAHCAADGAAARILESVFGKGKVTPYRITYAAMPGVSRDYDSIGQMQAEIFIARIWGGVHFRTSNEVGGTLGTRVGDYVLASSLAPALTRASD